MVSIFHFCSYLSRGTTRTTGLFVLSRRSRGQFERVVNVEGSLLSGTTVIHTGQTGTRQSDFPSLYLVYDGVLY